MHINMHIEENLLISNTCGKIHTGKVRVEEEERCDHKHEEANDKS
jgi:hypothetical protein